MKMKNCVIKMVSVATASSFMLLTSGCGTFLIDSQPRGAQIVINNVPTGKKTPLKYSPRHFITGDYEITTVKDGYTTDTPPYKMSVRTSGTEIILSVFLFPIFLPKNLFHNHWKRVWPRKNVVFQLSGGGRRAARHSPDCIWNRP